jgi:hypothetical protein
MYKTSLLLNSNYQILHFITERKALKLFLKGKVDILSDWEDIDIYYGSSKIKLPATLRMKYYINKRYKQLIFSKKAVLKRDHYNCQYCLKHLKPGQATVDHLLPKSMGGLSLFTNCVASCYDCNNKKGNRTPEQAGMELITLPTAPVGYVYYVSEHDRWHRDWDAFLNK